jgi:alpha-tubulin suppressor-like RCC1 family protein
MGISRSPWRLARLAGAAAVVLGLLAGGSPAAKAQGQLGPVFNPSGAVSWGYNAEGQLGDGTTADRYLAGPVSGLTSGVLQVSAGYDDALAITSGGIVWAWGYNGAGELGDGTLTNHDTPEQVAGLSGIRQVAAGFDHSLALRSDGTVWAWGGNDHGQLGNGAAGANQLTPVQVAGLTGVTKIAAGQKFSLALRTDGTVWAWGLGDLGQLGNGATFDSAVPVQTWGFDVTSIAAGWDAAYAVRSDSAGATVLSWGGDACGDLGQGTTATGTTPPATIPLPVIGITTPNIVQVTAGLDYALALGSDGKVWSWGAHPGSRVAGRCSVTAVSVVAAGSGITQLSAGEDHVLALAGGTALAWGSNAAGALGIGSTAPVAGIVHVVGLSGVTQLASGNYTNLAVYRQPQGTT